MAKIPIQNKSGQTVGYADTEARIYYKVCDYSKGQMFYAPKYRGSVGISLDIINKLLEYGIVTLKFWIIAFENEDFLAVMPLKDFIEKGNDVFFSGKENSDRQIICPIHFFQRIYRSSRLT